jgi:hypothetical protein
LGDDYTEGEEKIVPYDLMGKYWFNQRRENWNAQALPVV